MQHQNSFPWLSTCKPPDDLPVELVATCTTFRQALRLAINCARIRGLKDSTVADRLGIQRAVFSRIMSGQNQFPDDLVLPFSYLVGNWCLYQWRQLERHGKLGTQSEIERLEMRLKELRGAA